MEGRALTEISTEGMLEYGLNPYGPVGTILSHGSTGLIMTEKEWAVASYIALGQSYKRIAPQVDLTADEVGVMVNKVSARIPGSGSPRTRLQAWMWTYGYTHYETNRIPDRPRGRPPKGTK